MTTTHETPDMATGRPPGDLSRLLFGHLHRSDQQRWGHVYLQGLLRTDGKKTVRRMAAVVTGSEAASTSLHQFVNASPWEWAPARGELARWAARSLPVRAWTLAPHGAAQARQLLGRGAPALPAGVRAHRQLPTGPRPVPGRRAHTRPGRLAALPASPVHPRRGRARPGEDPRDDASPAAVGPRPAPGPGDDVTVGRANGAGGGRPDRPVRRRAAGTATAGRRARLRPRHPGPDHPHAAPNCRPENASRCAACCCAGAYDTRRGRADRSSRTTHPYAGCARTASAVTGRAG